MRRKTIIFLDEHVLQALEASSLRKAGHKRSRAIEHYLAIGLDVDAKLQLAYPVVLNVLENDVASLQRQAALDERARRKKDRKR